MPLLLKSEICLMSIDKKIFSIYKSLLILGLIFSFYTGNCQDFSSFELANKYYNKALRSVNGDHKWCIQNFTAAISFYEMALSDTNANVDSVRKYMLNSYSLLAEQHLITNDTLAAINDYSSILAMDSLNYEAAAKRADCYYSLSNFSEALKDYRFIADTLPERSIGNMGMILIDQEGMKDEGCRVLKIAVDKYPQEKYIFKYLENCRSKE